VAESVVVDHVSKHFTMQNARTLKQRLVRSRGDGPVNPKFLAIDDVSFSIEQGEAVGLMGLNGSGKSTLLKVINGVLRPDRGTVLTRGRISGLIEVSAGFHPDLSGRENIYLNAAILGMGEAEINRKFDEIVGVRRHRAVPRHPGRPVLLRHVRPARLLGRGGRRLRSVHHRRGAGRRDPPFKKKCLKRIREVRDEGRTIFFVSHNTTQVRRLCNRALVLEHGRLTFDGSVPEAIHHLHYDDDADEDGEGGQL
jgi:ABC-2 type transport system ATP-binding protein